ncbi:MAG: hypothetical protein V4725_03950 [Bacteroidota bacterium]
MRCLILSSLLTLVCGCSSAYRHLRPTKADMSALQKFKPNFTVALYGTQVDVIGNHLSGILLIKKMPDSSTRLVFSNEVGFKFFDFAYLADGTFKVYSIIEQMNKKPVIKTLRKDFELLLMNNLDSSKLVTRSAEGLIYYSFKQSSGYYHYITNTGGDTLIRMERASARKPVMQAIMRHYQNGMPDTIGVSHTKFTFTIGLKRIIQ